MKHSAPTQEVLQNWACNTSAAPYRTFVPPAGFFPTQSVTALGHTSRQLTADLTEPCDKSWDSGDEEAETNSPSVSLITVGLRICQTFVMLLMLSGAFMHR